MIVTRSAVVPIPQEEAWEVFNGNELRTLVELSDSVVEVRDYKMRDDGTPEYVMVNRAGPRKVSHRSDYIVYEPPTRTVDRVLDSSLGGVFYSDYQSVEGGTRVTNRWEVEPKGVMRLLFPLMRNSMERDFQGDLDLIANRLRSRAEPES